MKNKNELKKCSKPLQKDVDTQTEIDLQQKKAYIAPKLSYEGEWETLTTQTFGVSVVVPDPEGGGGG